MKHLRFLHTPCLVAMLLLAACTQDDLSSPTGGVEGAYPLEIASVTLSVEGGEAQPWGAKTPQTRVSENTGGTGSVFMPNDAITVSLGGETAAYTYDGSKWTSTAPLYWQSTQQATVNAWYPTAENVSLADQSEGLAYVLKGSGEGSYQTGVNLTFTHSLAKVRVALEGYKASDVTQVEIYSYTSCTNNQGTVSTDGAKQNWITMHQADYNGTTCWEANVVPGTITPNNFIRLNGSSVATVTGITALTAGAMYTVNLNVKSPVVPDDAKDITGSISDDGNYVVSGTRSEAINITGGSPTIYLDGATVSVSSGNAINITGGTPTIHVVGENTIETKKSLSNCYAGIYVAEGSSVTIEGSGTDDVLRVTGGADGAAIGGYYNRGDKSCGNIVIKNVTLHAYAVDYFMFAFAPGIGATGEICGRIEISSAIVYARSIGNENYSAPAIGAYGSVPEIVITDSEIHAYRGSNNGTSYADYIGRGGSMTDYQGGKIQYGSGSITGSTIYKYTYNAPTGSSSSDGSETY